MTNSVNVASLGSAMVANSSGQVGIGGTPGTKLDVQGTLTLASRVYNTGSTVSDYAIMQLKQGASGTWQMFVGGNNDRLTFGVSGVADYFVIGSSGQFGIGGANYGTSGQVLVSQGSGSAPVWGTPVAASAGGAVYENTNTISSNYTMTTNYNGMSAGPITINTGVTVTIPTGSTWVIV